MEDDPGDVLLNRLILQDQPCVDVIDDVKDGVEALRFLRREEGYEDAKRPSMILMDLNMPRMDGRETLAEIKCDESLKAIPVIILSTSEHQRDISDAYQLLASAYLAKPVELDALTQMLSALCHYWSSVAKLPY